jgi:hypothetical protein
MRAHCSGQRQARHACRLSLGATCLAQMYKAHSSQLMHSGSQIVLTTRTTDEWVRAYVEGAICCNCDATHWHASKHRRCRAARDPAQRMQEDITHAVQPKAAESLRTRPPQPRSVCQPGCPFSSGGANLVAHAQQGGSMVGSRACERATVPAAAATIPVPHRMTTARRAPFWARAQQPARALRHSTRRGAPGRAPTARVTTIMTLRQRRRCAPPLSEALACTRMHLSHVERGMSSRDRHCATRRQSRTSGQHAYHHEAMLTSAAPRAYIV